MRNMNDFLKVKYAKNYATYKNAIKALEGFTGNARYLIVEKDGRYFPVFLHDNNADTLGYCQIGFVVV